MDSLDTVDNPWLYRFPNDIAKQIYYNDTKLNGELKMAVYSEDLRVRVVEFLEKGHTQKEAAEVFGVSAKSVWIWNKMHK